MSNPGNNSTNITYEGENQKDWGANKWHGLLIPFLKGLSVAFVLVFVVFFVVKCIIKKRKIKICEANNKNEFDNNSQA